MVGAKARLWSGSMYPLVLIYSEYEAELKVRVGRTLGQGRYGSRLHANVNPTTSLHGASIKHVSTASDIPSRPETPPSLCPRSYILCFFLLPFLMVPVSFGQEDGSYLSILRAWGKGEHWR